MKQKGILINSFFTYNNEVFYRECLYFKLFSKSNVLTFIPSNVTRYEKRNVIFSGKDYFKSTEFMSNTYKPTINFQKFIIFEETKTCEWNSTYSKIY